MFRSYDAHEAVFITRYLNFKKSSQLSILQYIHYDGNILISMLKYVHTVVVDKVLISSEIWIKNLLISCFDHMTRMKQIFLIDI